MSSLLRFRSGAVRLLEIPTIRIAGDYLADFVRPYGYDLFVPELISSYAQFATAVCAGRILKTYAAPYLRIVLVASRATLV